MSAAVALDESVVALYVDPRGPYPSLVRDWYDAERNAMTYRGSLPVVAHPPCGPWSRLSQLHKSAAEIALAPHAVAIVQRCGGVLEHPKGSKLACDASNARADPLGQRRTHAIESTWHASTTRHQGLFGAATKAHASGVRSVPHRHSEKGGGVGMVAKRRLTKEDRERRDAHLQRTAAAQAIGFNELAKMGESLGEKVYYRMARDAAEATFLELGGHKIFTKGQTILKLSHARPFVKFEERDIELMRRCVAEFDAAGGGTE